MVIVTEGAKSIVHVLAASAGLPERLALRLEVFGEPKEGDEPVEYRGRVLLYISRMVRAPYDGCVVDLEHTPKGVAFSIGPPEAGRNARS